MEKINKSIDVYVANDGIEFISEKECLSYEKIINNIKYFKSFYNPDLTEGRGYSSVLYMAINPIATYIHSGYALQYVLEICKGHVVKYVQGCEHAAIHAFTIPELITKEEYNNPTPGRIGDYPRKVNKVFLSDISIPSFPNNIKISGGRIV